MVWVVNVTTRLLYPRERPGAHCIGVWVSPRAGLDGSGESRITWIRFPHRPARSESLHRLSYSCRRVKNIVYWSLDFLLRSVRVYRERVISLVHNAPSFDALLPLHTYKPRSRTEADDVTVATCSLLLGTYQIKGTSAAPCLLPTDTRLRLHTTTGRAVDITIDLSISLVYRERCVIYCNLMLVCHSSILISYRRHAPYPAYKMKQRKYTVSTVSLKEYSI